MRAPEPEALLILLLLPQSPSRWLLSIVAILYGMAGLSWSGIYLTLAAELVGQESAGVVSGLMSTAFAVGALATAPAFGYLADVTGSYTVSWGVVVLWLVLGIGVLGLVRTSPSILEAPRGPILQHVAPQVHGRSSPDYTRSPGSVNSTSIPQCVVDASCVRGHLRPKSASIPIHQMGIEADCLCRKYLCMLARTAGNH